MLKRATQALEIFHLKIFGSQMSQTMRDFIGHLSWSFIGITVSSSALFLVNFISGRILGPENYGKINLITTIAYLLGVFILYGQDMVAMKNIANGSTKTEKEVQMSNSLLVIFSGSLILLILTALLGRIASNFFQVSLAVIWFAVIYAIIFTLRSAVDSFWRGIHKFKTQAVAKVIESMVIVLVFLLAFYFLEIRNYQLYIYSLLSGFLFFTILFFVNFKNYNFASYNKKLFVNSRPYANKTVLISVLATLAISVDKLFVGKFIGVKELGLYSAYLTASILLVTQAGVIFSNAFFPMVSKIESKAEIVKKIDKLSLVLFLPLVLLIFLISFFLFKLFGSMYEINLHYLLLFAVAAFCQFSTNFYKNIVMSCTNSYSYYVRYSAVGLIIFLIFLGSISFFAVNKFFFLILFYVTFNVMTLLLTRYSFTKANKGNF